MDKRVEKILITEKEIDDAVKKAAKWVDETYKDRKPIFIGLLKGCIPFLGKLSLSTTVDHKLDFMAVESFKGETKAVSEPRIVTDLINSITGEDLLIVEDIIDSGSTLKKIKELLELRNPRSIKIITLLDKPETRKVDIKVDYSCFTIPNVFIIGCGLDYQEYYRNLPYIGVLKKEYIK